MSEIEKMYENAGIKKTKGDCLFCPLDVHTCVRSYDECPHYYPPFTAMKQLLLLQWIVNKTDLYLHRHKTDFNYSIASGDIAVNKNKDFKESIAEFINTMWQDLTEEEKQQVKGILE